ncbi:MAG: DegT/DnrJ/EryC1/StrS family aminotransferase [Planctomycetaceae bacterium]|nr:DegT/DnrJ/EryC1/StrS family aminotransferase [Planctomycetaceae bacterium]
MTQVKPTVVAPSTASVAVPLLDVTRSNAAIRDEILQLWAQIYDQGGFIGGPHVKNLEAELARVCESRQAIACASGSDALVLALMAAGIEPGDEVICPAFTFFATASAIWRLGATPVFADIDPQTFNIDPVHVRALINNHTKAIIPVHLFGLACDMSALRAICAAEDLWLIEDCAQSIGARYQGQAVGSIGDVGCFSFYPSKNLGGFGDGGFMTAMDDQVAAQLRIFANHGMTEQYRHEYVGLNSRLDSLQAAALWVKCRQLEELAEQRRANVARYQQLFADCQLDQVLGLPNEPDGCFHVWNQYTIRIPDGRRDEIKAVLAERKIGAAVYYPIPLNRQRCFASLGYAEGSLPHTELACREVLSLPVFPGLTHAEQDRVVAVLHEAWHAKSCLRAAG